MLPVQFWNQRQSFQEQLEVVEHLLKLESIHPSSGERSPGDPFAVESPKRALLAASAVSQRRERQRRLSGRRLSGRTGRNSSAYPYYPQKHYLVVGTSASLLSIGQSQVRRATFWVTFDLFYEIVCAEVVIFGLSMSTAGCDVLS